MSRRHDPTKLGMDQLEKATTYTWAASDGGYELREPAGESIAELTDLGIGWLSLVYAGGERYVGNRESLEDVFKATADLLFKVRKEVWLKMECQTVMSPWQGDLMEVE